jgi:hypothetical protein
VFGDDVQREVVRREADLDDDDAREEQEEDAVDAAAGERDTGVVVTPDDSGYRRGRGWSCCLRFRSRSS